MTTTANDPQAPWTEEQSARVNQVIQEEVSRARVAATFLPLYGPLPPDTDFVRREAIVYPPHFPTPPPQQLAIRDRETIQLARLQVKVPLRGPQVADSEMRSVLALFRRAANVLARLEDAVIFRGLTQAEPPAPETTFTPPAAANLPLPIWEIGGGELSDGLLAPLGSQTRLVLPPVQAADLGDSLVTAVSGAIGQLEGHGHFGPFAVVLDQVFFLAVQTPNGGQAVLPQDRIIAFLGGGTLLRSSTLPPRTGLVVALGGAPVELVVARDVSLQFLQLTQEPRYLFRVQEKMVLRIKEAGAIVTLVDPQLRAWSVFPNRGQIAGSTPTNPQQVTIRGINLAGATAVDFGGPPVPGGALDKSDWAIKALLPPAPGGAAVKVPVNVHQGAAVTQAGFFWYQ
jgi:uncharacterized linocin/CFP29 family protein